MRTNLDSNLKLLGVPFPHVAASADTCTEQKPNKCMRQYKKIRTLYTTVLKWKINVWMMKTKTHISSCGIWYIRQTKVHANIFVVVIEWMF